MGSDFKVKIGEFEGPLDLLLTLIEERKLHIADVSLASVADEFITYVRTQEAFPAGQAAHFILVSATLLLIKSKALLPVFELTNEEEEDVSDLEKRLNLYKIFRSAGRRLGALSGRFYFGGLKRDTEPLFSPAPDMTTKNLHGALTLVLAQAPKPTQRQETSVASVVSLEDMMGRLGKRIEQALSVTFTDFIGTPEDKREIVVGFLAVLELVKRGMVLAEQEGHFNEITMNYSGSAQAPRYE